MTSEVMVARRGGSTLAAMASDVLAAPGAGPLLRDWRRRRRLSQLDLALEAGISPRHLSFVETGRSRPSAAMVLRLTEHLDVPLRERNQLLLAAGHAPVYGQRDLDEPAMGPVREAVELVLRAHEPHPALAVDRHWGLVAANAAVGPLLEGAAAHLLEPPVNVLRLSLHPEGLAPHIANLTQWKAHLVGRLARQAAATGDPALYALLAELRGYGPSVEGVAEPHAGVAVPLRLRAGAGAGELALLSTVTTFGTATDITAAELSIESFFPADAATAAALRGPDPLSGATEI